MKFITDLKLTLSRRVLLSMIVTMLYIWETFIPCSKILVVVVAEQLYYQAIHNLCLSFCPRMEKYQQRESCVELFPESLPKYADKYGSSVINDGHRKAIMFPNMFEEELSSLLCCCSLLPWYEYSHLRKSVDYY